MNKIREILASLIIPAAIVAIVAIWWKWASQ